MFYLPDKASFSFPLGAFIYDSDPGTGGGAIQIIVDGELTIGEAFYMFLTYIFSRLMKTLNLFKK